MEQVPARGVQSVEISVHVLAVLAQTGRAMALGDLARLCGMAPAKLHRYLASLSAAGMVARNAQGHYDLGRRAAEIGIAAVARVDPVNDAADTLAALSLETGLSAMLSVWGTHGPTVVRWQRADPQLVTALGVGAVLPVLQSATGRVFLAWLPQPMLTRHLGPGDSDRTELQRQLRRDFVAEAAQSYIPGLFALAAPVFDLQDEIAAVITLVGTDAAMLDPDGPARAALQRYFARATGPEIGADHSPER